MYRYEIYLWKIKCCKLSIVSDECSLAKKIVRGAQINGGTQHNFVSVRDEENILEKKKIWFGLLLWWF